MDKKIVIHKKPDGEWVRAEDYKRLRAELTKIDLYKAMLGESRECSRCCECTEACLNTTQKAVYKDAIERHKTLQAAEARCSVLEAELKSICLKRSRKRRWIMQGTIAEPSKVKKWMGFSLICGSRLIEPVFQGKMKFWGLSFKGLKNAFGVLRFYPQQ